MNVEQLSDEKIKYLIDNMTTEFYHVDDYWVDVKWFFAEWTYVNHHTEYHCQNDKGDKWFGPPEDIVGKLIHVDAIFDEWQLRNLGEE